MEEIPRVRAEVGYPPLVTPMSQIVGTQAVFNVLTGKRWSVVSKEMKDYICGYYGKAPGPMDQEIVAKVVGDSQVLDPDVAPGSLVTTTFAELEEEIGDLAKSEEDVLMYALFPNEARTYLSKHRTSEKVDFLLEEESSQTKEEDYVDINQIRELVRVAEESGVGEIVVEEEGARISVRMPGAMCAAPAVPAAVPAEAVPAAQVAPAAEPAAAPADNASRPASWHCVTAPMVGTFYAAPAPGEPPFVKVGDEVTANQTLCIVEAMKLMNEITSEEMGVVREVCLEDATPVEFGTPLFYIEPHGARCSGSGDGIMFNKVLDRKPRRGGAAHHARLQGAGREDGGGLLHRGRQYHPCSTPTRPCASAPLRRTRATSSSVEHHRCGE